MTLSSERLPKQPPRRLAIAEQLMYDRTTSNAVGAPRCYAPACTIKNVQVWDSYGYIPAIFLPGFFFPFHLYILLISCRFHILLSSVVSSFCFSPIHAGMISCGYLIRTHTPFRTSAISVYFIVSFLLVKIFLCFTFRRKIRGVPCGDPLRCDWTICYHAEGRTNPGL